MDEDLARFKSLLEDGKHSAHAHTGRVGRLTHEQVHEKEEHDEDGTARAENLTSEHRR